MYSEYCFVTNAVNSVVVLYGKHRFTVSTVRLLEYYFVVSAVTTGQEYYDHAFCPLSTAHLVHETCQGWNSLVISTCKWQVSLIKCYLQSMLIICSFIKMVALNCSDRNCNNSVNRAYLFPDSSIIVKLMYFQPVKTYYRICCCGCSTYSNLASGMIRLDSADWNANL